MARAPRSRIIQGVPSGVQQVPLAEVRRRRALERALTSTLCGWAYEEVMLPLLDYEEVFERGNGHEAGGRMYRLIDPEGNVLGVRPDLTPLVARLVATGLQGEELPVRLYYAGEVVRPEAPRSLGRGEFHQIGFELIGGEHAAADLEVAVVALEALRTAGLSNFRMTLAHSGVLPALAARAGLEARIAARVRERLDRRDPAGLEEVLAAAKVPGDLRGAFAVLLGGARDRAARELLGRAAGLRVRRAIAEVRRLRRSLVRLGYRERVEIDLAEVGGFEYYTGVRYRVYAEGVGFPIGSGGRYDRLLARFGESQPAVGFSFSLDRVLRSLEASGEMQFPAPEPARAVRVEPDRPDRALRGALRLRRRGVRVRLC